MSMTDTLADMLTRIRNGQGARLSVVTCPYSRLNASVCEVLKDEGYIREYTKDETNPGKPDLRIELKYVEGAAVIKMITRISKPGRRVYSKIDNLKKVFNGLGISILSTPKGVLSDYKARQENVGGEVLCEVF